MGGKSSTQKTENMPPAWAVPLFQKSATEAQKIYDSGAGGNVYQGKTVADLGSTTMQGINGMQGVVSGLPSSTSSAKNLGDMASGAFLRDGNPYFNDMLSNQLDKTASRIQSQFAGSGRYGSGANTSVLSNELGGIAANTLYNQYNQDANRMLSANSQIDAANSNLFRDQLAGNQSVIDAGRIQDANEQAKLTADFTKWQSEDMQPWTRLGLLQSAAAGSAGNYGTNTQTQTQPFNALQPLGAIGSLFGKSDARAKELIEPVEVQGGCVVYEFSYRGQAGRYRGVMAQDIIERVPEAVMIDDDGLYAVNYSRVGVEPRRVA